MLPAAKVLLVTVLLGGGTVGTYALAGGSFGTGSSGSVETTQTTTPEISNPSADGQPQTRVEEEVPAASREKSTVEGSGQDGGPSNTLSSADTGKAPGSTDSANSVKGRPEVVEEAISTGEQQRDSQKETAPSSNGQEQPGTETSVIGESDTAGTKASLGEGSNEPGTIKDGDAGSQTGKQNVEARGGENIQENSASGDNQVNVNSSSANTGQNGLLATGPAPQNKEGVNGVNQTDQAITSDSTRLNPEQVSQA